MIIHVEIRHCEKHGNVKHNPRKEGGWRCGKCASELVAEHRRKLKRRLVEEHGSRCVLCGYDRCDAAFHFHHRDSTAKSFGISGQGLTRSWRIVQAEAQKCILLCGNCHAEVEIGYTTLLVSG